MTNPSDRRLLFLSQKIWCFDVPGIKLGSWSCWAGVSPQGIPIGHPHSLQKIFQGNGNTSHFPLLFFLFQKVCTHLHNWSGLFFSSPFRNCFELRMCCLDHDSYKVRELKSFAVGTWKSQGMFPYIAAEAFVAHSGLKGYYSKFIPEFFFFPARNGCSGH